MHDDIASCTAFHGDRLLAHGTPIEVALAIKAAGDGAALILVFDDRTGREMDFDLRGTDDEIAARLAPTEPLRGRGRPRLGVTAREVTLLPRHWDWLAAQPGGASVTLRKLVDAARRADGTEADRRASREAAYRVMSALAGNLPGFEEAARALYAGDRGRLGHEMRDWPLDARNYVNRIAFGDDQFLAGSDSV